MNSEHLPGKTQEEVTKVLEHKPGALCALINAVLSIDESDDSNVSFNLNNAHSDHDNIVILSTHVVYAHKHY